MDAQRVALITGAGSGIGRAAAVLFAGAGYAVALAGRREGPLRDTAALLGGARSLVIAADVADAGRCAGMVDRAAEGLGRLDVLVNNAGYAPNVPIGAHTAELLREVYTVNALGPAVAIARAWPVFSRQRSGCVVNVSTLGTLDPFPGFFGYAAAKAAANVMARSCATEGRAIGVRAFAVAPGAVETAMLRSFVPESVLPADATLRPEDVARVILACAQGERDADNGRVIVVEKGGIRLAP